MLYRSGRKQHLFFFLFLILTTFVVFLQTNDKTCKISDVKIDEIGDFLQQYNGHVDSIYVDENSNVGWINHFILFFLKLMSIEKNRTKDVILYDMNPEHLDECVFLNSSDYEGYNIRFIVNDTAEEVFGYVNETLSEFIRFFKVGDKLSTVWNKLDEICEHVFNQDEYTLLDGLKYLFCQLRKTLKELLNTNPFHILSTTNMTSSNKTESNSFLNTIEEKVKRSVYTLYQDDASRRLLNSDAGKREKKRLFSHWFQNHLLKDIKNETDYQEKLKRTKNEHKNDSPVRIDPAKTRLSQKFHEVFEKSKKKIKKRYRKMKKILKKKKEERTQKRQRLKEHVQRDFKKISKAFQRSFSVLKFKKSQTMKNIIDVHRNKPIIKNTTDIIDLKKNFEAINNPHTFYKNTPMVKNVSLTSMFENIIHQKSRRKKNTKVNKINGRRKPYFIFKDEAIFQSYPPFTGYASGQNNWINLFDLSDWLTWIGEWIDWFVANNETTITDCKYPFPEWPSIENECNLAQFYILELNMSIFDQITDLLISPESCTEISSTIPYFLNAWYFFTTPILFEIRERYPSLYVYTDPLMYSIDGSVPDIPILCFVLYIRLPVFMILALLPSLVILYHFFMLYRKIAAESHTEENREIINDHDKNIGMMNRNLLNTMNKTTKLKRDLEILNETAYKSAIGEIVTKKKDGMKKRK